MRMFFPSLFFLLPVVFHPVESGEESRREYLDLIQRYPHLIQPKGDFSKGEIQIVLDPEEMATIERLTSRDVGVVRRDQYWLWINDACIFPSGHKGVYGRILWVKSLESCPGVAVMPITPDGKVVVICNYRHAVRSWAIELPRGVINAGEELEVAARREAMEETGMVVKDLSLLGVIPPDTGLTNTLVPIFMAKVAHQQAPQQEESEAIEEILTLTIQQVKQAFLQGYLECLVRGERKRVPFRDPFLAYAILMYELKKEIPSS